MASLIRPGPAVRTGVADVSQDVDSAGLGRGSTGGLTGEQIRHKAQPAKIGHGMKNLQPPGLLVRRFTEVQAWASSTTPRD